jgi:hypothetical protein
MVKTPAGHTYAVRRKPSNFLIKSIPFCETRIDQVLPLNTLTELDQLRREVLIKRLKL